MATGEDLGHGPEWNDDGLPEVDVQIPDDIRELDREVQAYQREQRHRRRQLLLARFVPGYRRFGPFGVLAPVVVFTLLATAAFGSMMSLLGPRTTNDAAVTSAPPNDGADTASVGSPLPDVAVTVDGEPARLAGISAAVVVAVPLNCGCGSRLGQLISAARSEQVAVYLSGEQERMVELAAHNGAYPHVLDGAVRPLAHRYHPAGLSAVLVDGGGDVAAVERHLDSRKPLTAKRLEPLG